jgi:hypothetical protein
MACIKVNSNISIHKNDWVLSYGFGQGLECNLLRGFASSLNGSLTLLRNAMADRTRTSTRVKLKQKLFRV